MKLYFLYGTNLPKGVDRAFLVKTFVQFGEIGKIYLNPETTWFKIYFKDPECVNEAVSLSDQPPYYMQLVARSENVYKGKQQFQQDNAPSLGSSSDSMFADNSDYYASAGPEYYNIHGVAVSTLTDDDGTIYVPLNEVKEIGFELFQDDKIPKNINFDAQALNEFKIYLNIQARKYISKMQWGKPSEKAVEETKTEIINKYVSNGQSRNHSSRHFNNSSSPNPNIQPLMDTKIKTSLIKPRPYGGFDNQRNARTPTERSTKNVQLETTTPLRRPFRANDNTPQSTQPENDNENCSQKSERPVSTNGMSKKEVDKENVSLKVSESPVQKKGFLSFSQPKVKQIELTLHKVIEVTVAFVESHKKCWAYRKSDDDKMQKILYDVNLEARAKPGIQPSVGQIYAALYEGAWYRALVQEVTPSLKVQYIDFGNFNEEKLEEVRELSSELTSQPMLSVSLSFSKPPQMPLELSAELSVIPIEKNSDGSYEVVQISETQPQMPESPQPKEMPKLNLIPAGKLINNEKAKVSNSHPKRESPSGTKPKVLNTSNESQSKINSPNSFHNNQNNRQKTPSPNLTLKERLRNMANEQKEVKNLNPDRKSVVDLIGNNSGVVEFVGRIDDDRCLCFVFPINFSDDVSSLETISESPSLTGKIGDFISVCNDTGSWVRATILNSENNSYTVASVDYGKIISTNKVCKLEKKFVDIPEFVGVCSANRECIKLLEKNTTADFSSTKNNELKIEINDVFYNATCKRWNPFETTKTAAKSNEQVVFTTAPSTKILRDRERVLPVMLNEGKLLVKNKDSHGVFTKIESEISKLNASPLAQEPVIGQLVLCTHDTQTVLYRGIIKSLNKEYAEVEFIDHGFTDTVPIKKMMAITESLAKEDSSLIPIVLKGFEDGTFPDKMIEYIETCYKDSKKLAAIKYSDDVFDLIIESLSTGDLTLSSKFGGSSGTDYKRLMFQDITTWELKVSNTENVMCISIEDEDGSIRMMASEGVPKKMCDLNNEIVAYVETNNTPYTPIVDEICLAKYEDEWYRARVLKVNKALDVFDVFYLDFGNIGTIPSIDIRSIPAKCAAFPALAVIGHFKEIAENSSEISQEILNVIKNEMNAGDSYDAEILKKIGVNKYVIRIPSVSAQLSKVLDF